MQNRHALDYPERVRSFTETYCEQVTDCTRHLPTLLEQYGEDCDGFDRSVETLTVTKRDCDASVRQLRDLIGDAVESDASRLIRTAGGLVTLYTRVHAVVTPTGELARELSVMRPALHAGTDGRLVEMADNAVAATDHLTDAVLAHTDALVTGEVSGAVSRNVSSVRRIQSQCDDHKYDALGAAFRNGASVDALVFRELVLGTDAVTNAAEDAADHLASLVARPV